MLRFLTAGESHGMALTGIIEGLPAGLKLREDDLNQFLLRRQKSYGRGNRMKKIEKDKVTITGGIRNGITIGSPLALQILNKDWLNRKNKRSTVKKVPRPGHADLAGVLKYGFDDIQNVIERASARETAIRTAMGSVAVMLLAEFGIDMIGFTRAIGKIKYSSDDLHFGELKKEVYQSAVYCPDKQISEKMRAEIDSAKERGDTLGGVFEVNVVNVPPGLGSYVHWDRKIEGMLAQAVMSIPSVKAVEIGEGVANASRAGSRAHDKIDRKGSVIIRKNNRAGGIEGGVTNGRPIIVRGYAKPISSLRRPLGSVNLQTKEKTKAPYVRSDVCVVPAICVIAEAMTAWVLGQLFMEKFGGDSVGETKANYDNYMANLHPKIDSSGDDD